MRCVLTASGARYSESRDKVASQDRTFRQPALVYGYSFHFNSTQLAHGQSFGAQQVISTTADEATSVNAADLDGDGYLDVISASRGDDKVAWYENTGGGVFGPEQVLDAAALGAAVVFPIDLDGDGDIDVLSGAQTGNTVAWYENLGSGTFSAAQVITTASAGVEGLFATDLDGDGDPDLVVCIQQ